MLDSMDDVFVHDRLKVREWDRADPRRDRPTVYQPKRDGWHIGFYMQAGGTEAEESGDGCGLCCFARKQSADAELSHLLAWHPSYQALQNLPGLTSVVGEMWLPGKRCSDVLTAIKARDPALRFTAFAVPVWRGMDIANLAVEDAYDKLRRHMDGVAIDCMPTRRYYGQPVEELRATWPEAEGVVLKTANYYGWWKAKEHASVDAIVTGLLPGEGKHIGAVGSLAVSVVGSDGRLREVGTVGGMDDYTRALISQADIGRVVEVKYQALGSGGRLRHGRFIKWRDDKPAEQCTADQLEGGQS